MNIAVIRLSSLGDIIFCMASLQIIKHRFPESSITWVADRKFADILDHNPDITNLVKVDLKGLASNFSLSRLIGSYRQVTGQGKFDLTIDLHGMIKSAAVASLMGGKHYGFHRSVAKEPLSSLFYSKTFALDLEMNTVYRYASLAAQSLEIPLDEAQLIDKQPYLFYHQDDLLPTRGYFRKDKKNIIFVVGSTWESRNYPKEKFVTIANSLKENVLICAGNAQELATAAFIAERSPHVTILPAMNLNQLKAAISQADLVIGGDTGPSHIAWANNIPAIVIFGPTPAHRIYPTTLCRIIKSSSSVNERKLNKNDFSIREIEASLILRNAGELLQH